MSNKKTPEKWQKWQWLTLGILLLSGVLLTAYMKLERQDKDYALLTKDYRRFEQENFELRKKLYQECANTDRIEPNKEKS